VADRRQRLLFIKSRRASFIELDQELLAERYEVTAIYQPGRYANPLKILRAVRGADVIVGWWASWHTFLPFTVAWLLRKPSLLIVGGFDTAAEPEYGYGYQLGGPRKYLSRFTMRRARVLMTNSEYSRQEVERNCGIPAERVAVLYHGIPDEAPPATQKQQLVLTVGIVDATNLERKGLRPFAQAAALLPEVEFVLAGPLAGDAGERLAAGAPTNLRISGWLEHQELQDLYARAAVYVQASKHEGFGVSVAEAMLARCVPVVTTAGALPEVVGDAGVILSDPEPATVAAGIREALTRTPGEAARARVLERFSVERRRQGLHRLIDALAS
jgi:glycosyltransferase involved in cell wall biosynthesis